MKFIGADGTLARLRRYVSSSSSVAEGDLSEPGKLAEVLRKTLSRLSDLESRVGPEGTEFEVDVGDSGTMSEVSHNFNCPIRWWVTLWTQTGGTMYPAAPATLVQDAMSTNKVLVLRSYVAGKAVIRVERAGVDVDPGITVVNPSTGGGGGGSTSGLADVNSEVLFQSGGQDIVVTTNYTRVGARVIDMSKYPTISGKTRHVRLLADVNKTVGATSGTIQLWDTTHNVLVTSTNMVTTSTANEEKDSGDLTVGSSSGNIRSDVASNYELQLKVTGGTLGNDAAFVTNARIVVYYT